MYFCANSLESYICGQCYNFKTHCLTYLKKHITNGHELHSQIGVIYKCLLCQFETFSNFILFKHQRNCRSKSVNIKVEIRSETDEKPDLPTQYENHHHQHRQRHFPPTTHDDIKCSFCPKTYKRTYLVNKHVKRAHMKRFPCDQCPVIFKLKNHLLNHIIAKHTSPENINWFQCEVCPKKFKLKDQLQGHILARHTAHDKIKWFECAQGDGCPMKFKTKRQMQLHVYRKHTDPRDIKWFECEVCSSKFKLKHHLQGHVLARHTADDEIRWFECEICPKKYKNKDSLTRHARVQHFLPVQMVSLENLTVNE